MSKLIAVIVSLRFSPGHASHMAGLGKAMEKLGYAVVFYCPREFSSIMVESGSGMFVSPEQPFPPNTDVMIIESPALTNQRLVSKARAAGCRRIVYIYHEPWESFRQLFQEGARQRFKSLVASFASMRLVRGVDVVWLPSRYALSLFERSCPKDREKAVYIPLLFDDETVGQSVERRRPYILGYVGTIAESHDFKGFISLATSLLRELPTARVLISSRSQLPEYVKKNVEVSKGMGSGSIVARCGRIQTSREANDSLMSVSCSWNAYRRSTQSGVLPRAFMCGTPCLATRIGSFEEYVCPTQTGEFLDSTDVKSTISLVEQMQNRQAHYALACRKTFLSTFYYESRLDDLRRLVIGI